MPCGEKVFSSTYIFPTRHKVNYTKRTIRSIFHKVGFEIHRLSPTSNTTFQLYRALENFGVDLVFDIGANVGQFSSELRSVGYRGEIVSFEPLSLAHRMLEQAASGDPKWHVHPRTAIGDQNGEIMINIAGNSVSSSALPMTDIHSSAAAESAYVGKERAPICTLDSVADPYLTESEHPFLKIDTQGFEWQVLDGAINTLKTAQGVLCELSLVELYEGQNLWKDMIDRLENAGFVPWSVHSAFTSSKDGRTLQIDAAFFRNLK